MPEFRPVDVREEEPLQHTRAMLKPQELGDSRSGQTDLSPLIPPAEPELSEPCTSVDPLLWTAFLPGSVAWAERIK